jgi:predicted Zn-dependent protease with MMP-like domain
LTPRLRQRFDKQFEWVLARMPPLIHELIERVPLHVEDYPSRQVMREMNVECIDDLCGLFTGVPLSERGVERMSLSPDVVTIYREGILSATADADDDGRITRDGLRKQIRITILHELAHYHGLTEEELERMGYG